jgi:tyrosyl-tRNA synthetase
MKGDIVKAKEIFAFEITKAVHGLEKATEARETAKDLFLNGDWSNAPQINIKEGDLPKDICDIVVLAGLENSKSKARKLIEQNGLSLNHEKVNDFDLVVTKELFERNNGLLLKKGKKTFVKVVIG